MYSNIADVAADRIRALRQQAEKERLVRQARHSRRGKAEDGRVKSARHPHRRRLRALYLG